MFWSYFSIMMFDTNQTSQPRILAGSGSEQGRASKIRPFLSILNRVLWPYLFTALVCVLIVAAVYKLHKANLRYPFENVGDALFYQALFKNYVETGNYYINASLGAPGRGELYDFPVPHSTHLIGFTLLCLFTHDYGLAFNLYYLATYPLIALAALYVLRRFSVSAPVAVVCSILYAFLTFHVRRSQAHYILGSYYLAPFILLVALWLCTGKVMFVFNHRRVPRPTKEGIISIITCILVGGDNPYYALFAGLFVVCGALLGYFRFRYKYALVFGAALSVIVATSFVMNLTPNLIHFRDHGRNPMTDRPPSDAEVYGLKIVQMLFPATNHRIPAFAQWKDTYNRQAPLVNENDTATLGIIASVGFFVLLAVFFAANPTSLQYSLAVLNLCGVLVGTIGGFGALFAFLVWPQFRGYNRISPFIAFLSLFAVALLWDYWIVRPASAGTRTFHMFALGLLAALGLADQIPRHSITSYSVVNGQQRTWRSYFGEIQGSLPSGSMIFQLPYLPYPQSPAPSNLGLYDELIPYLETTTLHWSYGSMAGREADQWNRVVASRPISELVDTLAASGFSGLLIDRFGYEDRGAAIEGQLNKDLHVDPFASSDGRYAYFPLAPVARELATRYDAATLEDLRHPLFANMGKGCWPVEIVKEESWQWCDQQGELVLSNTSGQQRKIEVQVKIRTAWPGNVEIQGLGVNQSIKANNIGEVWRSELTLPPGKSSLIIRSDARPVDAPADPRHMVFMAQELRVSDIK
jgi:phosphoglycerol transferase